MKKVETTQEDELRPEYDLKSLRVRKVGPGRQRLSGRSVQLAPDVAVMFPDSESVNEALRFLIHITRENTPVLPGTSTAYRKYGTHRFA